MASNIHDGHRDRLKTRFLKHGLDSFESHQVLELLLFFSIPRKDTNPLAHKLLNTFGSLPAVFNASIEDLCKIKGVSEHTATLIKLCGEFPRRYEQELQANITSFSSLNDIAAYLQPMFRGVQNEITVLVCLNNRMELLGAPILSTGTLVSAETSLREIVEQAVRYQATRVVLAHNHPAGNTTPSGADLTATRHIIDALKIVEVGVLDHMIFAQNSYVSMRQTPHYAPLFSDLVSRLASQE